MSSTPSGEWLTVSQAAAALVLSEKTIRKRLTAGEIPGEKEPLPRGGVSWRVPASWVETERKRAGIGTERDGRETEDLQPERNQAATVPELVPLRDGTGTEGGTEAGSTPNGSGTERLLTHMKEENKFLRSLLEARDRDAAELRAALREALRLAPKQLTDGGAPDGAQDAPSTQVNQTTPAPISGAGTGTGRESRAPAKREPRPLWKVVLGIR